MPQSLVIGILHPGFHHALVAQIFDLLEQKQPAISRTGLAGLPKSAYSEANSRSNISQTQAMWPWGLTAPTNSDTKSCLAFAAGGFWLHRNFCSASNSLHILLHFLLKRIRPRLRVAVYLTSFQHGLSESRFDRSLHTYCILRRECKI